MHQEENFKNYYMEGKSWTFKSRGEHQAGGEIRKYKK